MCLIVWKGGKNAVFTEKQFDRMLLANRDGLGIMWREGGRVKVEKTIGDNKKKRKLWDTVKNYPSYAMHSRLKTHGMINEDNCHPYELMNIDKGDVCDLYMMHNGIISGAPNIKTHMSDTWNFIEGVLKPIAQANVDILWDNEHLQTFISKNIGASKLLFMRSDKNEILIFNEQMGNTITGCWLSNLHSTGDTRYVAPLQNSYSTHNRRWDSDGYPWWNHEVITQKQNSSLADVLAKEEWEEGYFEKTYGPTVSDPLTVHKPLLIENKQTINNSKMIPKVRHDHLLTMLQVLRSMSDTEMKRVMREDPQEIASIILYFYTNCTMNEDAIIGEIENEKTIDNTVNLLRQISVNKEAA